MADSTTPPTKAGSQKKIKFHYLKSNLFRVIHVDGALGGLTPTLDLFFTLYSQRAPIPNLTVQPVLQNGQLGEEIVSERVTKDGIIREPEVGVMMSLSTARAFHKWLTDKLELADKAIKQQQVQTKKVKPQ